VKYHAGARVEAQPDGLRKHVVISMPPNPSHLEAVDPVLNGMARAAATMVDQPGPALVDKGKVLAILIHGDAAMAGQGVVLEGLQMSQLRGYRIGGTVHIVINNQVGFTTLPEASRTSVYATDVAKTIQAPIWHVSGDDPELLSGLHAGFEFRQRFNKDVVIDLVCYRRRGHNEAMTPR
jgi:2-oxoglutarate dehydrogenase E1 component